MSGRAKAAPVELFEFEQEVELLARDFQERYQGMSHRAIAEGIGRVFAIHCLHEYGIRGYQFADHGIHAILEALSDGIRKRAGRS
jgi:hypothetical protein